MALHFQAFLLFVWATAVVSSTNASYKESFCKVCASVEDKIVKQIEKSMPSAETIMKQYSKVCSTFPESYTERFKDIVKETAEWIKMKKEDYPRVCPILCKTEKPTFGSQDYIYRARFDAAVAETNAPLQSCHLCAMVVKIIWERLHVEQLIKRGEKSIGDICSQAGLASEKECSKAIEEFAKMLDKPNPKLICGIIGLCKDSQRVVIT